MDGKVYALLGILAGLGAGLLIGGSAQDEIPARPVMPAIVGRSVQQAECVLAAQGIAWRENDFRVMREPRFGCAGPGGAPNPTITSQRPKPGTLLEARETVQFNTPCTRLKPCA